MYGEAPHLRLVPDSPKMSLTVTEGQNFCQRTTNKVYTLGNLGLEQCLNPTNGAFRSRSSLAEMAKGIIRDANITGKDRQGRMELYQVLAAAEDSFLDLEQDRDQLEALKQQSNNLAVKGEPDLWRATEFVFEEGIYDRHGPAGANIHTLHAERMRLFVRYLSILERSGELYDLSKPPETEERI